MSLDDINVANSEIMSVHDEILTVTERLLKELGRVRDSTGNKDYLRNSQQVLMELKSALVKCGNGVEIIATKSSIIKMRCSSIDKMVKEALKHEGAVGDEFNLVVGRLRSRVKELESDLKRQKQKFLEVGKMSDEDKVESVESKPEGLVDTPVEQEDKEETNNEDDGGSEKTE